MNTTQPALPALAATRCWMEGRRVYLEITARRSISFPTSKFDRLAYAPQVELEKLRLNQEGRAVRWDTLDLEILVEDVAHQRYVVAASSAVVG